MRPAISVQTESRFCGRQVVDLTAGCSFGCLYCPFADLGARLRGVAKPTAMGLGGLERLTIPSTVFLSPASDAFAPQALENTHAFLAHVLPRGTIVGIVTKGIVPERTADLLACYADRIEGIGIGVTSLDDARNRLLEPGCPPARERLANVNRLAARGLTVAVRLDPLFPAIDDLPDALAALVDEAASRGAAGITATYVFAWGRVLRRLRRQPSLVDSCRLLAERAPMAGGMALSVPLARKLDTYGRLATLAAARGLRFNTCGCKDLRVAGSASFQTTCGNGSEPGYVSAADDASTCPPSTVRCARSREWTVARAKHAQATMGR